MATRRRGFARGDRLGELLREILAEELARIDDDRLGFVTITGVKVDRDLAVADVYFSTVDLDHEVEAVTAQILERHRRRLQSALGRQAHVRRVPLLRFHADESMHTGARVEEILRGLRTETEGSASPPHETQEPHGDTP